MPPGSVERDLSLSAWSWMLPARQEPGLCLPPIDTVRIVIAGDASFFGGIARPLRLTNRNHDGTWQGGSYARQGTFFDLWLRFRSRDGVVAGRSAGGSGAA